MINDKIDGYEEFYDKSKIHGMGGWLIVLASWYVVSAVFFVYAYTHTSRVKMALAMLGETSLPDTYFLVADVGYSVLFFYTVFVTIAFFRSYKHTKRLEIINLLLKVTLMALILYVLGDVNMIFNGLTKILNINIGASVVSLLYLHLSRRVKNTFTKELI